MMPKYFSRQLSGMILDGECFTGYYYCEFTENGHIFPCIEGMGWNNGLDMGNQDLSHFIKGDIYLEAIKKLANCKRC